MVIAASVKTCIVIVINILFKQALRAGFLGSIDFVLILYVESCIIYLVSSIKVCFSGDSC